LASTLVVYSSSYSSGELNVTLINPSGQAQNVEIKTTNFNAGERFYWYSLKGDTDNGDFSRKVIVNGSGPKGNLVGGPSDYATLKAKSALSKNGIKVTVPAWGSVYLVAEKK
jgi:aspartate 1-decarboxylase